MLNPAQIDQAVGQPLYDTNGSQIGLIGQVYVHAVTREPEWATVHTGEPGTRGSFVPLAQARTTKAGLSVPYSNDTVVKAPQVEVDDGVLSPAHAAQLYRYYGVQTDQDHSPSGLQDNQEPSHNDPTSASGQVRVTRSEERLQVATTTHATETIRLRKHIVTEEKTITVSVRREVFTLERAPVLEQDIAPGGDGGGAEPSLVQYETVLHEEQIIVQKNVVPVERVTVIKDLITEDYEVTEQVRKEQIDTDTGNRQNL